MTKTTLILLISLITFGSCSQKANREVIANEAEATVDTPTILLPKIVVLTLDRMKIEKDLLFDKHTLKDTYSYGNKSREFQWEKIKKNLYLLDSIQIVHGSWGILQNYRNDNGHATPVRKYAHNEFSRATDSLGVERNQSVPLFLTNDTTAAERYGRDGTFVKFVEDLGDLVKVETVHFPGEWLVPKRYVKIVSDTVSLKKTIFVDVTNQNIATLEKVDKKWLVRSMNPATTGFRRPPYQYDTPLGIFFIQEKKPQMLFLKDGTKDLGGYAPNASRITNGAYIHGVPVNLPAKEPIEYSWTLGTTPRSHMCVRNATSHAKFIYDWAPAGESVVFVIN